MILFVHGLGSCGWGTKSLLLRRHFGVANVLAPDLPFHPQAAVDFLAELCQRYPITALVGSSLGGFYVTCLNQGLAREDRRNSSRTTPRPSILINPVVYPHRLLDKFRGPRQRWCDLQPFQVGDSELEALQQLQPSPPDPDTRYLVLLQQGDEVLDYREAATFYAQTQIHIRAGGDHRFQDLGAYLPEIDDWIRKQGIGNA